MDIDVFAELLQTGNYVTPKQAANELGIGKRQVLKLFTENRLIGKKIGNSINARILILRTSLKEYGRDRKKPGNPAWQKKNSLPNAAK